MAVATSADAGLNGRGTAHADVQPPRGGPEIDFAATGAGADAGSLAGGMAIVAPFVPLGAAVVLLFLYLTGLAFQPPRTPVPVGAIAPPAGAAVDALREMVQPLRAISREAPVTLALVLTMLAWLVVALLLRHCHLTSPRYAGGGVFDDVLQRYVSLRARIRALEEYAPHRAFEQSALQEARDLCRCLGQELTRGGPGWALGTSYVNVWRLVHRTEEALIAVQPHEDTIAEAVSDELRVRNSRMQNESELARQVAVGVATLDVAARRFLVVESHVHAGATRARNAAPSSEAAPGPDVVSVGHAGGNGADVGTIADATTATTVAPGVSVTTTVQVDASTEPVSSDERQIRERQALAVLRTVRRSINDFRDSRRDELVRLRNHLRATTTLTNVATFVILAVAIRAMVTDDAPNRASPLPPLHDPIIAATAFYFVGALVGLIDQLYRESQTQSATEDYGLFDARLTLTPVLSGLSAVGGVLLGAMLLGTIGTSAVIPGQVPNESRVAATATAGPTATVAGSPTAGGGIPVVAGPPPAQSTDTGRSDGRRGLADIFSLGSYAFGLVVAAIFGLTPRLFIDRLRTESHAYVNDLQATSSGQSRPRGKASGPTSIAVSAEASTAGDG